MPYPDEYRQRNNFEQDERNGLPVHGSKVYAEYAYIARAVNSLVWFLKKFTLADGRVNTHQTLAVNDMIDEVEHTAEADGLTVFAAAQSYSPTDDYIRVFLNDAFVPQDDYTHDGESITFNAPSPVLSGDKVRVRTYLDLRTALQGTTDYLTSEEGASQVGIKDNEGRFNTSTVEGALQESAALIADLWEEFGARNDYVLADGSRGLDGNWEVNARSGILPPAAPATGSFDFTAPCADGDTFTAADGTISRIFQFTNDPASIIGSNIQVNLGVDAADQAAKFVAAFNPTDLAISATATDSGTFWSISLIHNVPGAVGNQPIAWNSSSIANVIGMDGGVDEATIESLATLHRIRNLPRAIRDGDPVVWEQLGELQVNLSNLGIDFVRTDGSSVMDGDFNAGNHLIFNLAPGQLPTHAVNLDQMTTELTQLEAELIQYVDEAVGNIGAGNLLDRVNGTAGMERTLPMGDNAITELLAGDNGPDSAMRRDEITTADANLQTQIDAIEEALDEAATAITVPIGGCGLGETPQVGMDVSTGGEYQTEGDTTITGVATGITNALYVRVKGGNLDIFTPISAPTITLDVDGDININNPIDVLEGLLIIRASGTITVNADLTAGMASRLSLTGKGGVVDYTLNGAISPDGYESGIRLRTSKHLIIANGVQITGATQEFYVEGDMTAAATFTALGDNGGRGVDNGGGSYSGGGGGLGLGEFGGLGSVMGIRYFADFNGSTLTASWSGGGGAGAGGDGGLVTPGGPGNIALPPVAGEAGAGVMDASANRGYLVSRSRGGGAVGGPSPAPNGIIAPSVFPGYNGDLSVPQRGGNGGGWIVMFIGGGSDLTQDPPVPYNGDLNLNGAALYADGQTGIAPGGGGGSGGGGGGMIKIAALGTITDGAFYARGGNGTSSGQSVGGGGGGSVFVASTAVAGVQNPVVVEDSVTGGTGNVAGEDGLAFRTTDFTADQLVCLRSQIMG